MDKIDFKQFLQIWEDVNADISQLNMQKQQLVVRKANQDRQIDQQIDTINKAIMLKQKQQTTDDQNQQNQQQNAQSMNTPSTTTTTTPGSDGSQTPGSGSSSSAPMR